MGFKPDKSDFLFMVGGAVIAAITARILKNPQARNTVKHAVSRGIEHKDDIGHVVTRVAKEAGDVYRASQKLK